jgi:flagellar motility protein MotE (MotC chaperone)
LLDEKETMTQQDETHFELHDKNKDERYQRQKIIHLEDRMKVLEKSVERLNKLMGDVMGVKE